MSCFFSGIRDFSNNLDLEAKICMSDSEIESERIYQTFSGKVNISFYSLNSWMKWSAITVCALAIITALVGAGSLFGANIISTKAAYIMVGCGSGMLVFTVSGMAINHLLFLKRFNEMAEKLNLKEWNDPAKYHGNANWGQSKSMLTYGVLKLHGNEIFAKRYGIFKSGLNFYIEFYRTRSINSERKLPRMVTT